MKSVVKPLWWQFDDIVVEPPTAWTHPPVWMDAGCGISIRRVAAQGFCLLLGQHAPPLYCPAAGGPPGRKLQSAVDRDKGLQIAW